MTEPPDDRPHDSEGSEARDSPTPDRESGSGTGSTAPVTPELLSRFASLIEILESELPPGYRGETYRILAPRLLRDAARESKARERPVPERAPDYVSGRQAGGAEEGAGIETAELNLAPYAGLLSGPGNTRLKALAALDVAASQLGVFWMKPAEVERLLIERAGARSIYRTNLSTALSKARGLVDRRRRGRGYEYRITDLGRDTLHRELALLGG